MIKKIKKIICITPLILTSICHAADLEGKSKVFLGHYVSIPSASVTIQADIYNEVTNNTDHDVWIMAYYNLFIENCGNDPHQWKVKVAAHGTWRDHWRPTKQCSFRRGNYRIDAQGAIKGISEPLWVEEWKSSNVSVQ